MVQELHGIAPLPPETSDLSERAIHELLFDPSAMGPPSFLALWMTRNAAGHRSLVWIDPSDSFYPLAAGECLDRLHVLRPRSIDLAWSAVECLRCKQVGAVIAVMLQRPSRVEVRRLQLAAEQGGGVGVLLRPDLARAVSHIYAAKSRWRVSVVPGERTIQRWRVEMIHGHGRQGQSFIVEKNRGTGQTNFMPVSAALADHAAIASAS